MEGESGDGGKPDFLLQPTGLSYLQYCGLHAFFSTDFTYMLTVKALVTSAIATSTLRDTNYGCDRRSLIHLPPLLFLRRDFRLSNYLIPRDRGLPSRHFLGCKNRLDTRVLPAVRNPPNLYSHRCMNQRTNGYNFLQIDTPKSTQRLFSFAMQIIYTLRQF